MGKRVSHENPAGKRSVKLLRFFFVFAVLGITLSSAPTDFRPPDYRDIASRLIGAALTDTGGYQKLQYLCDRIGNRISGSASLQKAVEWAAGEMKAGGLANVHTQPVQVLHWIRGRESLALLSPFPRNLVMLGLGKSVGTGPTGITAQVLVVRSFEELEAAGRPGVEGKIVLYNAPFTHYGETVKYRGDGPSRAAKLGAKAVLVRSVTARSLKSPHTGALHYEPGVREIPAAAVTIEDAELLTRLSETGETITVRLDMEAHMGEPVESANVIGEIPGREKPEEVVVIGGHLDSWDVGQGAQDDGSGCVTAMQAAVLIKKLGLTPRRTIRVVLWTEEEEGGSGGRAYTDSLKGNTASQVAAIEMDGGAERPIGFETPVTDREVLTRLRSMASLLEGIGVNSIIPGEGEADTASLERAGVPVLGLRTTMAHYFDWHHTEADTVDKVRPADLQANIAAMAVMSYVLADSPIRLK